MRPKQGNEFWKIGKQFVIFYDFDEFPVAMFDDIHELMAYQNKPYSKYNYKNTVGMLYQALRREDHYTEMLGSPMTVYLIDIDDDDTE